MASDNEWISTSADYIKPRSPEAGDAWAEEAASKAAVGRQSLTGAGEVHPPASVAESLGLAVDETVIARQRIMYADDAPVEIANTYYPAAIAKGTPLAAPRKIKGGAVACLANLGYTAARVIEDITARPALEAERDQLNLGEHEPVVVIERLTLDSSDRPIQADVMVAPAALRRLRYELKVD
ncbi:GntR family transcriptional regulator [Streptomyces sp. NBC_01716]|uniref:GntR family transcriptional regulator n=1 Tax=Streptomyces sp. NBC_01716 TaxID=2975917 RepID=UPI002E335F13|nr:UTRA domain-containing protein [Streptomyces sp. NBC_01716]